MSYLIKKDSKNNTITFMQYDLEGYKFTPKSKNDSVLNVKEIVVINPTMIDKILTIKFNNMYNKLMTFIMQFLNDQTTDTSSGMYALSEIDRLKSILFNKYQKFLSQEKQQLFFNKLNMMEQQLKMNMMMKMNYMNNYQYPLEEKTQGKGR